MYQARARWGNSLRTSTKDFPDKVALAYRDGLGDHWINLTEEQARAMGIELIERAAKVREAKEVRPAGPPA